MNSGQQCIRWQTKTNFASIPDKNNFYWVDQKDHKNIAQLQALRNCFIPNFQMIQF